MTEDLRSAAKKIQEKGRAGDTVLAHISPHEAEILKMMGGYGSTNPETGLPEYKKFWKNITAKNIVAAAPIIIAVAAPGIGSAIGGAVASAVGATVTAAEAAAIGSAVVGGATTAAQGGKVSDILQSAATAGLTSAVASGVGQELASQGASQAVQGAASGAAGGATSAAMQGKDPLQAALTGGIVGGATGAYQDVTAPTPTLTQPLSTTPPVDLTKPVDYSLLPEGTTAGGQGLKVDLPPIDYSKVIDYSSLLTPSPTPSGLNASQQGLKSMGGGTGFTVTDSGGQTAGLSETPSSFLKDVGGQAVKYLATEAAQSLFPSQSSDRSRTLTSTGLFQPTSIVPTAATGIAPTERTGSPILGDSDEEEKSGAWGRKTLKG